MAIKIYEVDPAYVSYLSQFTEHLFHNKNPGQQNSRKYIGVLITVHSVNYFAPLSSFKPKHHKMSESVDFLKIKNYAVININNMFPVPEGLYFFQREKSEIQATPSGRISCYQITSGSDTKECANCL